MKELEDIIEKQKEFQEFVGFPISSNLEKDRNELSEKYVFKLIEEAIELRKEFPSIMNPWSKNQKEADLVRIKEEMSDVFLFFLNLMSTWRITPTELFETITKVQENNFTKVKEKKMKMLNESILNIPGYTVGIGSGKLTPRYVFVGQNPGEGITHGYRVWSNQEDGSSKVLLPILANEGVLEDSYSTNLVKCVTEGNRVPTQDEVSFWKDKLIDELDILRAENPEMKIITMGNFVRENLQGDGHIQHPAYVLRGGITKEEYEKQVQEAIACLN